MSFGTKYATVGEIIAEVTSFVDDEDMTFRSRGHYIGMIRDALQEMAFDTMYDDKLFTAPVPASLVLDLPEGLAGIKNIHLFNGPKCDMSMAKNVYIHRGMIRLSAGEYVADNVEGMHDRLMETSMRYEDPNLYYCGIYNGQIAFSSTCAQYENVVVQYSGIGSLADEDPVTPLFLKEAVVDYCAVSVLRVRHAKDPNRWAAVLNNAQRRLEGGSRAPFDGSWHKAVVRVAQIDPKLRQDMSKYLSSFGYGR